MMETALAMLVVLTCFLDRIMNIPIRLCRGRRRDI